jgi:hypothetical protein
MNPVSKPSPAVNTHVDTPGERDLMLTALRVAATRTRLQTNVFDCVGVALRQKAGGLCRRYGVAQGRGPARSPAVWSGGRAMSWDSPVWKAAAVEYRSNRVVNGGDASEDQSPAFSDDALALQFAELHEPRLRYVAQWNKWFFWDATCWKEDATLHHFNFSRQICRKAATACNKGKSAKLASSSTVAAVVSLARSDRRLAATIDQWDADPWLLNTPDGTIDLRTGERHPHESKDYITQCTAISPGGACPL